MVENLIRYRVLRRLIWVCTVCLCPTKNRSPVGLQQIKYSMRTLKYNYTKLCIKRPLKNRQNKDINDKRFFNEGGNYSRMLPLEAIFWYSC